MCRGCKLDLYIHKMSEYKSDSLRHREEYRHYRPSGSSGSSRRERSPVDDRHNSRYSDRRERSPRRDTEYRDRDRRDRDRDRDHDRDRDRERYDTRYDSRVSRSNHDSRDSRDSRDYRGNDNYQQRDRDPVKFDRQRRLSPLRNSSTLVVPLHQRPRPLQNWDVAPHGFERIRADIAKQTGLFPPPGNVAKIANFAPPVLDPARAAMLAMLSGDTTTAIAGAAGNVFVGGTAFGAAYAKHSKRLYVGNLPVGVTERELEDFFNMMLISDSFSDQEAQQPAVASVVIGADRLYAFVDFSTTEMTNLALNMNGMQLNGCALKIKRPRDPNDTQQTTLEEEGKSDQYILWNIPEYLEDAHVKLLLQLIGDLKVFIFLRHRNTKQSARVVVFQFDESIFNEIAVEVLSQIRLEEHDLRVMKMADCRPITKVWNVLSSFGLIPDIVSVPSSRVVMLANLIPSDTLSKQPLEHFNAVERLVRQEAERHGPIQAIVVPKPGEPGEPVPGLGFCYVQFADEETAERACEAMAGRRFDNEVVLAGLYPEERFSCLSF